MTKKSDTPVKRSRGKAHPKMQLTAYLTKMDPETVQAHAASLVSGNKPEDIVTFRKYVTDVLDTATTLLKEQGWLPSMEKGSTWNGYEIGTMVRTSITGQEKTDEILEAEAQLAGLKGQVTALTKKLKTIKDYEVTQGNGTESKSTSIVVRYPKSKKDV